MIRGQARFLGKPVRAPDAPNTAAILPEGGERGEFSPQTHGMRE
jgi:hypothetical protein